MNRSERRSPSDAAAVVGTRLRLKIAQIAPPWLTIPPQGYGGIEWIVSLLADGLTDRGHDVTLFASGGSATRAHLDGAFHSAPGVEAIGDTYYEASHAHHAYARAPEFDVVHDHTPYVGPAIGVRQDTPVVHTIHWLLDQRTSDWYRALGPRLRLVSISDSQRAPAPDLSYAGRVYNGIPLDRYPFRTAKEDFLLFVGRAHPQKGAAVAVEVAARAGLKLVLAGAIKSDEERAYWAGEVEPRLTGSETLLGEITHDQKADLMGRARAVLFPISWPEPFGLVMAEANACGTPVLAFPQGAVPEVIADGVTGYLVADADAMIAALARLDALDPAACRAHVERHFSAERMVEGYEEVYARVLGASSAARVRAR